MVQVPRKSKAVHAPRKTPGASIIVESSREDRIGQLNEDYKILKGIGSVTICSSSKFYATAKQLAEQLAMADIKVFTPRFDCNEQQVHVGLDQKVELTHEFLRKIRQSDAVYVLDVDGYTGRSVCIEIGYAAALGKTIVLAEQAAEGAVYALADVVVPVESFASLL